MPTDASGVYSLPSGYLVATGDTIVPSQHNTPLEDIQSALSARLPRTGVAPMTGALRLVDGTSSAPGLAFANATSTGIAKTASGFGLYVGGSLVAELTSGGVTTGVPTITNAGLAAMAAHTFKGNNTGSSAAPSDLTATQLTAELNAFAGDAGSGGTKGLVPAPASGDAAGGKFLKADGTFAVPAYPTGLQTAFASSPTAFVSGGTVTIAHGLGAVPLLCICRARCIATDGLFNVGDEIPLEAFYQGSGAPSFSNITNATNVIVSTVAFGGITTVDSAAGWVNIALAKWNLIVRAWK